MKVKSELVLYHMFWLADHAMRPSVGRIGESFEAWAYKNGFFRQIRELERRGMVEEDPREKGVRRVMRLTQQGVLRALGGTDPVERWNRSWDGQWRMTLFDLPENKRSLRNALRKELRAAHFGCLQGSVWISPDAVEGVVNHLKRKSGREARTILFFSGRPCDEVGNADLVGAAWDWKTIGNAYGEYRKHLRMLPRRGAQTRQRMLKWGNLERDLWARSLSIDPLLPRELWPPGYAGEKAWQEKHRALKSAGSIVRQC